MPKMQNGYKKKLSVWKRNKANIARCRKQKEKNCPD